MNVVIVVICVALKKKYLFHKIDARKIMMGMVMCFGGRNEEWLAKHSLWVIHYFG